MGIFILVACHYVSPAEYYVVCRVFTFRRNDVCGTWRWRSGTGQPIASLRRYRTAERHDASTERPIAVSYALGNVVTSPTNHITRVVHNVQTSERALAQRLLMSALRTLRIDVDSHAHAHARAHARTHARTYVHTQACTIYPLYLTNNAPGSDSLHLLAWAGLTSRFSACSLSYSLDPVLLIAV